MKYISVREAAEKWNVSLRQVQHYCAEDKIPGAVYMGKQWVIPSDAPRPVDGRTRSGKARKTQELYRFPVFIYSPFYRNPSELNEAEQMLLHAQRLYFEGDYTGAITECREILDNDPPRYLAAGAHFTIGMSAMWLGALYEFDHAIEAIDRIMADDETHGEDLLLLRSFLQFHVDWDTAGIFSIRPSCLTAEAVPLYKYSFFLALLMSTPQKAKDAFPFVLADLVSYENEGITPLAFTPHSLMGTNNEGSLQEREPHLQQAVRIAVENGWMAALSKYYPIASDALEKSLESYDGSFLTKLKKINAESRLGWQIIVNSKVSGRHLDMYSKRQIEFLFFLSNGYSFHDIAAVQGISRAEILRERTELYKITGTSSKAELSAFAKKLMDPAEAN